MCDKHSFREPTNNPIKQAGELYLEYLEREQKQKEQHHGTGGSPARDIDYVF